MRMWVCLFILLFHAESTQPIIIKYVSNLVPKVPAKYQQNQEINDVRASLFLGDKMSVQPKIADDKEMMKL